MFCGDWSAARGRFSPERLALQDIRGDRSYTFLDLYDRMARLTFFLFRGRNINKGDRVALCAPWGVPHFDLFFAAARIGAIIVPVDPSLAAGDIESILRDASPSILFYSPCCGDKVSGAGVPYSVRLDEDYDALLQSVKPLPVEEVPLYFEDPVALVYRRGRDELWRGIIVSHGMICWNTFSIMTCLHFTAGDSTFLCASLSGMEAFLAFSLPLYYSGGLSIIPGNDDWQELIDRAISDRVTFHCPSSAEFCDFMASELLERGISSAPRLILHPGGSHASADHIERLHRQGILLADSYITPLAGPHNFAMPEGICAPGYAGAPLFHVEAMVADEGGRPVREGAEGELLLRGHHIFSGYWNRPQDTRADFFKGWLRTGDRAFQKSGLYAIADRKGGHSL